MPAYRYVVVDVFTATPLEGNQLAVFTDATGMPEGLLQPLAREINFSETMLSRCAVPNLRRSAAHDR